jgi:hypothetical protein
LTVDEDDAVFGRLQGGARPPKLADKRRISAVLGKIRDIFKLNALLPAGIDPDFLALCREFDAAPRLDWAEAIEKYYDDCRVRDTLAFKNAAHVEDPHVEDPPNDDGPQGVSNLFTQAAAVEDLSVQAAARMDVRMDAWSAQYGAEARRRDALESLRGAKDGALVSVRDLLGSNLSNLPSLNIFTSSGSGTMLGTHPRAPWEVRLSLAPGTWVQVEFQAADNVQWRWRGIWRRLVSAYLTNRTSRRWGDGSIYDLRNINLDEIAIARTYAWRPIPSFFPAALTGRADATWRANLEIVERLNA